jgi:type I restriction enzyme R subunit
MLDTGIDIPEVVNLVFFKLVRSKTKFWQMLGRGTRLCPDLFEPGKHTEFFFVFDYCQNLEYFSQDIAATEGTLGESLSKRLFNAQLELIGELDHRLKRHPARFSGRLALLPATRRRTTTFTVRQPSYCTGRRRR